MEDCLLNDKSELDLSTFQPFLCMISNDNEKYSLWDYELPKKHFGQLSKPIVILAFRN